MGGAVSAGEDNDELIDNLVEAEYIKSPHVEQIFRAVDRGDYYVDGCKENAYRDLAWKHGNIHLSAPCIYSEVMESLKLGPGMSFLNLGSGTGYLSTMAGLVLGSYGINHGVELHEEVVDYAKSKLEEFQTSSPALDKYEFCPPNFVVGNCLLLDSSSPQYDRVYCGASCPSEHENYIKNLVRVGGILVMPLNDHLLQVTRTGELTFEVKNVLPVSFASLVTPQPSETHLFIKLPEKHPLPLQEICRSVIRVLLRANAEAENPSLKDKKKLVPTKRRKSKRRIRKVVIPVFEDRRPPVAERRPFVETPDHVMDENSAVGDRVFFGELSRADQEIEFPTNDESTLPNGLYPRPDHLNSDVPTLPFSIRDSIIGQHAAALAAKINRESDGSGLLDPDPSPDRMLDFMIGFQKGSHSDSDSSIRGSTSKASDSGRSSQEDSLILRQMYEEQVLMKRQEEHALNTARLLSRTQSDIVPPDDGMDITELSDSYEAWKEKREKVSDTLQKVDDSFSKCFHTNVDSGIDNISDDSVPENSSSITPECKHTNPKKTEVATDPEKTESASGSRVSHSKVVNTDDYMGACLSMQGHPAYLKRVADTDEDIYLPPPLHAGNCCRKAVVFKRIAYSDVDSDDFDEFDSDSGKESYPKDYDSTREKSDLSCYTYYMKQKINHLPLPYPLKMYLNFSRPV